MSAPPFLAFPSTPHLLWLGEGELRDDKLMSDAEADAFLRAPIIIEEKVDGANIGLSTDDDGELWVQNRGAWITPPGPPQFTALWPWIEPRRTRLIDALWPDLILFGEWCHATHAIHYDALPDWFLGFDVFERSTARFWSSDRRDALLASLGLEAVPRVAAGIFSRATLLACIGASRLTAGPMEGVYLRREADGALNARAKIVRSGFIQPGAAHWSRQAAQRNQLAWAKAPT